MIRMCKRNLLMTVATVILMTGGTALAQEGEPVEQANLPQVTASMEQFDFGRVVQGASISHIFWLKNVGGDTLKITDIKPG